MQPWKLLILLTFVDTHFGVYLLEQQINCGVVLSREEDRPAFSLDQELKFDWVRKWFLKVCVSLCCYKISAFWKRPNLLIRTESTEWINWTPCRPVSSRDDGGDRCHKPPPFPADQQNLTFVQSQSKKFLFLFFSHVVILFLTSGSSCTLQFQGKTSDLTVMKLILSVTLIWILSSTGDSTFSF